MPDTYGWVFGVIFGLACIAGIILFFYFIVKSFKDASYSHTSLGLSEYSSFSTHVNEGDCHESSAYRHEAHVMHSFIRKVYLLLLLQLAITFGLIALFLIVKPARLFIQQNWWIIIIGWVVAVIALIPLIIFRKKSPLNIVLLIVFTLGFSVGIAFTCTYFGATIVFQASLTTLIVFIGLTVFTFQSGVHFSFLSAGIITVLICVGAFIVIAFLIPFSSYFQLAYGLIGAILFSIFIIYDTAHLMEKLGPGDEILMCVKLYLDLIYLLLYILIIFGGKK